MDIASHVWKPTFNILVCYDVSKHFIIYGAPNLSFTFVIKEFDNITILENVIQRLVLPLIDSILKRRDLLFVSQKCIHVALLSKLGKLRSRVDFDSIYIKPY